jgi:hypothetical protein
MEYTIRKASEKDKFGVARLILKSFENTFYDPYILAMTIFYNGFGEDDLVMIVNGNRVGYHKFIKENLNDSFLDKKNPKLYKNKTGVNGCLFCIHPDFRKMGLGSKFIQFEKNFFKKKYDYIWGAADIKLNNSCFWSKNRDFLIENKNKEGEIISITSIQNL